MNTNTQIAPSSPASPAISLPQIDTEKAWQLLIARDPTADFLYGVRTTHVFCRPNCKSRLPLRKNVRFFRDFAAAEGAGFRPCKRCNPTALEAAGANDRVVERMRGHLETHLDRPVRLKDLARIAHLSPFTVQRLFKRTMGVSPLQYQRALRAGSLRAALRQGAKVTDAIYEAGFGSPSRAYEGAQLGMTPARFARGGEGETIRWATGSSRFGWIVAASTERGLCWLALADTRAQAESSLREEFPAAELQRDPSTAKWIESAVASVSGGDGSNGRGNTVKAETLDLRGTAFQLRVWQALRRIPRGETRSYSELARELGDRQATRAVARACAVNRVALVVPCHRVIGADGSMAGYRWGTERKKQLLNAERA